MPEVPSDGLCLCAFVVLASEARPDRVLLGKINPEAPWDHLGALDPGRIAAWKDRWMLPSSHLLLLEDPHDSAVRILRELVGLPPRPLEGPIVTSEVYTPVRHPAAKRHWDLEFIIRGRVAEREVGCPPPGASSPSSTPGPYGPRNSPGGRRISSATPDTPSEPRPGPRRTPREQDKPRTFLRGRFLTELSCRT